MQTILIVDDESDICEILSFNLQQAGYKTIVSNSGTDALQQLKSNPIDLILLDVMMPGLTGFEVAQQISADPHHAGMPIVFLTALGDEMNTLHGFELGAYDYIAKPFRIREVLARVKSVLSRKKVVIPVEKSKSNSLSYETLELDLEQVSCTLDGKPLELTRREFQLLETFLSSLGKVFSRADLLARVWPEDSYVLDRTVDVHITRLRKKLGRYGACLKTRQGYGYLWEK